MSEARFKGYRAQPGNRADRTLPWLKGKFGMILPYDDETLSCFVEGARRFKKLSLLKGARVFAEGDGEGTVLIPNARLDQAAGIIGVRRIRAVSEAERERLRAVGSETRFSGKGE